MVTPCSAFGTVLLRRWKHIRPDAPGLEPSEWACAALDDDADKTTQSGEEDPIASQIPSECYGPRPSMAAHGGCMARMSPQMS